MILITTCVRGRPRSSANTTRFFCLPLPSFRNVSRDKCPEERHGLILGGTVLLVIVGVVTTRGLYSKELYTGGLCPRISSAGIAMEHI
ncbi:thiazole biosynthesis trna modification protein [Lasius niger]|uniref:Thiazole biosynthesis trna modification protein n=1 Tax=Lasius niger TaxID=67767 RepID=A0A0J7L3U9_LASNI|nr:thiazole biosynthesis trna modification protein [Lasius niger]